MSVPIYADHNVHRGIADGLRIRGVDVLTALDDGMDRAQDEQVLSRATQLGRLLFTNDADFLGIANQLLTKQLTFAGIAYRAKKQPSWARSSKTWS